MASFLGSTPHFTGEADGWGTTWFQPLEVESLAAIEPVYDAGDAWWQHIQALTAAAVQRWGANRVIGHTDLGGNLDILASLRGTQELLYDLIDQPDEVERLTQAITALWLRYYDELHTITGGPGRGQSYWAQFWSPGTGYMLQSDFCYMISPAMFERFVLPDIAACCRHLDYPFYHLDGKGQLPHLDALLSIPELRGVQWQPGDGQPLADGWLDVLARIREAEKLCQVYVKRDGALTIMRELGGTGFQFQIINEDLTPAEAEAFVEAVARAN
jgi:5-methyltetrahydrofolate--homocysteine methyltransferase